jgi:hypothetical protein
MTLRIDAVCGAQLADHSDSQTRQAEMACPGLQVHSLESHCYFAVVKNSEMAEFRQIVKVATSPIVGKLDILDIF